MSVDKIVSSSTSLNNIVVRRHRVDELCIYVFNI